jgi:pimeloyl-ACP methyl ester carboxylesterase
MGGRIALCTAAWFPTRISALASIDFAPDGTAEGRRGVAERIGNQPDVFASIDDALRYHGHDPADAPEGHPLRARFAAFLRPVAGGLQIKRDLHYRNTFRAALATGKPPPVNVDLWAMLTGLAIPMLFVRGDRSDLFAPATMTKLADANPRVTVREIAGSHDLAHDNPGGVAAAIDAFLQDATSEALRARA